MTNLEEVNGMGRRNLVSSRLAFRAWYYFRLGYSTYLTFLLGYVSTLITVYYLAIRNMPSLLDVFPNFAPFAVLATVAGVPVAIALGWVHMKRSRLYSSETDIAVEANPYNYKLPPGMPKEVNTPATILTLKMLRKIAENNSLLSDSEKAAIDDLEKKLQTLMEGGYVGLPRSANF